MLENTIKVDPGTVFIEGLCDPCKKCIDLPKNNYWTEIVAPGIIYTPDEKPEFESIYSVFGDVSIINTRVIVTPKSNPSVTVNPDPDADKNYEGKRLTGRKVIIEALINLTVTYVGLVPEQSMHTCEGKIPFSAFVVVPNPIKVNGVDRDPLDVDFQVIPCLEDIIVKEFFCRQLHVCPALFLQVIPRECITHQTCDDSTGCVCTQDEIEFKGVCPPERVAKMIPAYDKTKLWTQMFVPEILNIPMQKPDICKILSVVTKLEILKVKVIATPIAAPSNEGLKLTGKKLVVIGMLKQTIAYISSNEDGSVNSAHFDVPFSSYIVLPYDASLNDLYEVEACIEDIYACPLNPRQIFKNVTIFLKANELPCRVGTKDGFVGGTDDEL